MIYGNACSSNQFKRRILSLALGLCLAGGGGDCLRPEHGRLGIWSNHGQ